MLYVKYYGIEHILLLDIKSNAKEKTTDSTDMVLCKTIMWTFREPNKAE